MLLLIDNYDSFTYNLFQYLGELGEEIWVTRNNEVSLDEIAKKSPQHIVISPGPGTPEQAGISNDIIRKFGDSIPILGVCLGHQCVGYSYGAKVKRASEIKHGKSSLIYHDGKGLFQGLPNPFPAIRYHSLVVMPDDLPKCLTLSAWTNEGIVMGIRHRRFPVEGVQFHPESIMTEVGKDLLKNFLKQGAQE
jgi:anthranilate synthase/aminodeoxychorismate synthase-like glutamine amidotransferase